MSSGRKRSISGLAASSIEPNAKRKWYFCTYQKDWESEFKWIKGSRGPSNASCTLCWLWKSILNLKKIHTKFRSELKNDTLCSLLSWTFNQNHHCYEYAPSAEVRQHKIIKLYDYRSKKLVTRFYTLFGISCHVMTWFLIDGGWQLCWMVQRVPYMWPLMGFPHISMPRHISKGEQERDLPFLRSPRLDISVKESKREIFLSSDLHAKTYQ